MYHNYRSLNFNSALVKTTRKFCFLPIEKQSTHFTRVKVGSGEHVLEMSITVLVLLFHHDHGIRLTQERPSCPKLTQLNELQYNLTKAIAKQQKTFLGISQMYSNKSKGQITSKKRMITESLLCQ